MRQAQDMQKKMQKLQEELGQREYEGSAAAGAVTVVITGAGLAKKIKIEDSLVNVAEKEVLEDLIIAAFNNAKNKADEDSASSLKSATHGMPLPPGFKI